MFGALAAIASVGHVVCMFERSGSLRQSSVKATIGLGGAFVEDGEYAWALCASAPCHARLVMGSWGPILPTARLPFGKASATSRGKEMLSFCAWRTVGFRLPESFRFPGCFPDCQNLSDWRLSGCQHCQSPCPTKEWYLGAVTQTVVRSTEQSFVTQDLRCNCASFSDGRSRSTSRNLLDPGRTAAHSRATKSDSSIRRAHPEVEYQHNATEQLFHPRFLQMLNGTAVLRFASWQMIEPLQKKKWRM